MSQIDTSAGRDPSRPIVWAASPTQGAAAAPSSATGSPPLEVAGGLEIELGDRTFRAVLVDLDGTLLASSGEVTPRTRAAISEVQRRGIRVMVATGRSLNSAVSALRGLTLETPILCFNGGSLYCTRREELLRHEVLGERLVSTLTRQLHAAGLDFFLNRDDEKLTLRGKHPRYEDAVSRLIEVRWVETLDQLACDQVSRITVMGPADRVKEERKRILERYHPSVYVEGFFLDSLPSHREFGELFVCDLHPPSLGKAEAIRYLEEEHEIRRDDVVAIGDGKNDLSMLRAAGMAVAMANSHEDVLALAEQVTLHHDEDGVAAFLEATFLS